MILRCKCKSVCVSCENKAVDYQGRARLTRKRGKIRARGVCTFKPEREREEKSVQASLSRREFVKLIFIHLGKKWVSRLAGCINLYRFARLLRFVRFVSFIKSRDVIVTPAASFSSPARGSCLLVSPRSFFRSVERSRVPGVSLLCQRSSPEQRGGFLIHPCVTTETSKFSRFWFNVVTG